MVFISFRNNVRKWHLQNGGGFGSVFWCKKKFSKIPPVLRESAGQRILPERPLNCRSILGAVPLYVEQGSLLYRTGQQFSKSSLGRLETDQLSRVGIGSSFRATATLDPVWEYSLRIGKSSVDEGASAPEQRAVSGFNLGQFCDASRKLLRLSSNSYLVDPASSHMLVSKIKPCMSKYKPH